MCFSTIFFFESALSGMLLRTSFASKSLREAPIGAERTMTKSLLSCGSSLKTIDFCSVLLTGFSICQHLYFFYEFTANFVSFSQVLNGKSSGQKGASREAAVSANELQESSTLSVNVCSLFVLFLTRSSLPRV